MERTFNVPLHEAINSGWINPDTETVRRYLDEEKADYSAISNPLTGKIMKDKVIDIDVNDGDWKHSHLRLKYLMNLIGFVQIKETVTEENGDDTYSATHRYARKELVNLFCV